MSDHSAAPPTSTPQDTCILAAPLMFSSLAERSPSTHPETPHALQFKARKLHIPQLLTSNRAAQLEELNFLFICLTQDIAQVLLALGQARGSKGGCLDSCQGLSGVSGLSVQEHIQISTCPFKVLLGGWTSILRLRTFQELVWGSALKPVARSLGSSP